MTILHGAYWVHDSNAFGIFFRSHVKIPENYFKILEEGKNVGKFIFRRNVKIPENEPRKRKNPGKLFRK